MIISSNFRGKKKKKLIFQLLFSTYLLMGLLKFRVTTLIWCKIWFLIQGVPMFHTFDGSCYIKNDKYIKKKWLQSHFSCISHFPYIKTHRKYGTWVLLGWWIQFCIQQVILLEIWVKTLGVKFKIQVEKLVFSFFSL